MSSSKKIAENMEKFRSERAEGLHFSGKSSLQSLDFLDFQKKEICSKLVQIFKKCDLNEDNFVGLTNASSITEARAAVKFRTERLTLERLAELYAAAIGDAAYVESLRTSLVAIIRQHKCLPKVVLNDGVRASLSGSDSSVLHLDFLVALIEKLELAAPSSKTPNALPSSLF